MAQHATKNDFVPQWTKRVVTDLGGRDPLGLSRVGQRIADELMPGIITQTNRARYYAIYCWILWHIQQEEKPDNWENFASAFQRREAAVALSTMIIDANSSPVGTRVVRRRLALARGKEQVNTAFLVLPSNRLGGFGQYYAGCLYQLGLTRRLEDGMDRVTEGIAEKLALAVNQTFAQTPYLDERLFTKSIIDLRALQRSSERLGLDAISHPFATDERKLLIDLFFGFHEANPSQQTLQRRTSLARILVTIDTYEKTGIAVEEVSLDEQLLYAPTYFGVLVDSGNRAKQFTVPEFVFRSTQFWRQFCLHQFLTQALEGMLHAVLQVLEAEPRGIASQTMINLLLDHRFNEYLENLVGGRCENPRMLLARLGITKIPDEITSIRLRDRYHYNHRLSEWACKRPTTTPAEVMARSCLLLAVLYGKWRGVANDVTYAAVAERAGADLATPSFIPLLDSWLEPDSSWDKALDLLMTLIRKQHDKVMYGKGRLESCWLHADDDRLVRDQDYQPYFRSSRQSQAVQILADLGLLKWKRENNRQRLQITTQGRRILERILREQ